MAKVLLVEHDPLLAALIEDRLHTRGHAVELLANGATLATAVGAAAPDLLVLDAGAPGADPVPSLGSLPVSSGGRPFPIIVLADETDGAGRLALLRAGADEVLAKPVDLDELELRADRLLGVRGGAAMALAGELAHGQLWDAVQYIEQGRRDGTLLVRSPTGSGRIEVRAGAVVAARWERLDGREAALAMFGLKEGRFRFLASGEGPAEGSRLPIRELLMDAAWLDDELSRRRRHLPATGEALRRTGRSLPAPEEDLAELPFGDVLAAVERGTGRRLFDLVAALPLAPQKVRLAAAWLVEKGVLAPAAAETSEAPPSTIELSSSQIVHTLAVEVVAAARRAGLQGGRPRYLVAAEYAAWGHLEPLWRSAAELPDAEVDESPDGAGGEVAVGVGEHRLALRFHRLPEGAGTLPALAADRTGLMLWLADPAAVERRLQACGAAPGAPAIVVAATSEVAAAVRRAGTRWQVSEQRPRSLIGLLRLLQPPR